MAISAAAQNVDSLRAEEARLVERGLNDWLSAYSVPHYRPSRPMGADSFRIDRENARIDFFFNEPFYSQTLTQEGLEGVRAGISRNLPEAFTDYRLNIYGRDGRPMEDYVPNLYRARAMDRSRMWGGKDYMGAPWTQCISRPYYPTRGLKGRHVFVTPSHGRYYNKAKDEWNWQRPYLFCTTEDLFTQSIVNPFLIPMLERAGAVVCSARERDYQTAEAVTDNDTPTSNQGTYAETEREGTLWTTLTGTKGFALPEGVLTDSIMPFSLGTVRAVPSARQATATAIWTPRIPRDGSYAVYVAYATRTNSVDDAHYTVRHKGGETHFLVNQQMGGGTWVYLGTFEFAAGQHPEGSVVLTNESNHHGIVTADAVRFGGGRGRNVRGTTGPTGLPRHLENARAYAQWAGMPDTLFNSFRGENDYNDDIRCRPYMANWLSGGSVYNPTQGGGRVPFEAVVAVHSDAGYKPYDFVGTLGICTTDREGKTIFPSGVSRQASADLAHIVLQTIANDLSATFKTDWRRRETWDRNYGESRLPDLPSIILETLSHQNFNDLRYGHDPNFKFVIARSIYKALLRYVNAQHGTRDVVVQPLPVRAFAALLDRDGLRARLSWKPTDDELEPTAAPTQYILYTKRGDGGFDNGRIVRDTQTVVDIEPGVRYSFRIAAVNDGGESFPSETLSVFSAKEKRGEVLIVNGFDRLSGPAYVLTPDSAGFDLRTDIGVPYVSTSAFAGYQENFDRTKGGEVGPEALGFCNAALEGAVIAGNNFALPETHGAAIAAADGFSYSSCSREAAAEIDWAAYQAIDYIAGLQRDAPQNMKPYKTFDTAIRRKMETYQGGIFVSGAYIGTDMQREDERAFTRDVLGYTFYAQAHNDSLGVSGLRLHLPLCSEFNNSQYAVQQYDVLLPADHAFAAFAYADGQPAGVASERNGRRVVAAGFPFECITDVEIRNSAMRAILKFLSN